MKKTKILVLITAIVALSSIGASYAQRGGGGNRGGGGGGFRGGGGGFHGGGGYHGGEMHGFYRGGYGARPYFGVATVPIGVGFGYGYGNCGYVGYWHQWNCW